MDITKLLKHPWYLFLVRTKEFFPDLPKKFQTLLTDFLRKVEKFLLLQHKR